MIHRNNRVEILLVQFFYQTAANKARCARYDNHGPEFCLKLMYICGKFYGYGLR
jgi:hypothetical protein